MAPRSYGTVRDAINKLHERYTRTKETKNEKLDGLPEKLEQTKGQLESANEWVDWSRSKFDDFGRIPLLIRSIIG